MRVKKEDKIRFKQRVGRKKEKVFAFDIMRDGDATGVYEALKEKVSLEELSELIYSFFDEVGNVVVEERLGVELPCGIGYIQVSGIKERAYKLGDASKKLKKAVVQPNYHTEGYVFVSWYKFTNNDSTIKRKVGLFENAKLYRLKAAVPLQRKIKEKIKSGKWNVWAKFDKRSEMFGSHFKIDSHIKKKNFNDK